MWQRTARRLRVPLGFVVAAVFLVFARPSWATLAWSLLLVLPGLWLRGYAAGFVKKNSELTRTGPYAYTRNPLYLGSMLLAAGFAVAAGRWWPVILSEEAFLRGAFAGFDEYAKRVPRLMPRLTAAHFSDAGETSGRFSADRYRHHREYNAAMGAAMIYIALLLRPYAALLLRMWFRRP